MMKNLFQILCGLFLVVSYSSCMHSEEDKVDVLIIGGGASGVTSGIQSARMGANTLILEESTWLGGMLTSAGVSAVDGNYNPQIQISAESETKRSIFREKDKTKRSKKESAQHSKSRNKSFVMTSVSAL